MGQKIDFKLFFLLLSMALFLTGMSIGGGFAYDTVLAGPETYENGTAVGGIDLSGLTKAEAKTSLQDATTDWKQTHSIMLNMIDTQVTLPSSLIQFNLGQSLEEVMEGASSPLSVAIIRSNFSEIEDEVGVNLYNKLLLQELEKDLKQRASSLNSEPIEYSIYDYVEKGTTELYETISQYTISIPEGVDPSYYVKEVNKATIKANDSFSLLEFAQDASVQNPKALHLMASTIYGATLKTNFTIKERHISQHRPAYIPRGREASVKVEEDHDLVFVNVNSSNYELQTEVTNGNLVARWVGYPLPDEYEVAIKDAQTLDPRTVVHYSTEVYQTQVKQEGSSGEVYKLYRTINGESATKLITEDYYSPVNRIEVRYQPVESSDSSSNNNSDSDSSDDDSNSNDDSTDGSNNGDDTGDSNSTSGNDGSDGTNDDTSTDSTNDNQDDSNDVIQDPEDIWDISDGPSKGE
ncbi:hypothetical protein GLW05_06740 [Pontibacillus yanchengensis]|uniref:G5 domain-containing protein n=1 Tax=Pontibacillus yanchengensis TaxID=462910 RepID=A0A6I4ZWX4_9BACI|nr:hypothetical protein [Pontibacillus yanchengensis]